MPELVPAQLAPKRNFLFDSLALGFSLFGFLSMGLCFLLYRSLVGEGTSNNPWDALAFLILWLPILFCLFGFFIVLTVYGIAFGIVARFQRGSGWKMALASALLNAGSILLAVCTLLDFCA